METRTEAVKKTPGDLKREKFAQELAEEFGGVWKFFGNYPIREHGYKGIYSGEWEPDEVGRKILASLEERTKKGQIKGWRSGLEAFNDDGQKLPYFAAVYIKVKPQVK